MPQLKKKNYSLSMILQDAIERIDVPPTITIHPPQKDRTIFCDPEKLEIVFVNLLVNAVQAIEGNEGKITIKISDDANDDKFAIITVTDTGVGIPQEIIGKIFEPLFTTKQVGTSIVEQHGGTITASSALGNGSTFTIRIPVKSDWDDIHKNDLDNSPIAIKS
jgi:signal transduction histidine kinase